MPEDAATSATGPVRSVVVLSLLFSIGGFLSFPGAGNYSPDL